MVKTKKPSSKKKEARSVQSRQNFKKDFTGPGWDGVVYFVEKALAMQRKYGRY